MCCSSWGCRVQHDLATEQHATCQLIIPIVYRTSTIQLPKCIYQLHHMAHGFLVPKPRIEPRPLAVKALSPNHWTTREFPLKCIFENMSDTLNIYKELLIICTIVPSFACYLSSSFYFFPIKLRVKTKLRRKKFFFNSQQNKHSTCLRS